MKINKFRAWDKKEKFMLHGQLLCRVIANWHGMNDITWADLIKMQFINKLDRCGVEIYEGDIWKGKMCFGPGGKHCQTVVIPDIFSFWEKVGYGDWEKGEVIGNKFENPELLKECT